jgi:hypothetical protein
MVMNGTMRAHRGFDAEYLIHPGGRAGLISRRETRGQQRSIPYLPAPAEA